MAPTDRVRRQVKGRGVQGGKLRVAYVKRRALSEMPPIPILDILSNGSLLFYPAISSIAMDRTRTEEVILDGGYAEAFAYCLLAEGYASTGDSLTDDELLVSYASSPLRQEALQLALLFGDVYLHGCYPLPSGNELEEVVHLLEPTELSSRGRGWKPGQGVLTPDEAEDVRFLEGILQPSFRDATLFGTTRLERALQVLMDEEFPPVLHEIAEGLSDWLEKQDKSLDRAERRVRTGGEDPLPISRQLWAKIIEFVMDSDLYDLDLDSIDLRSIGENVGVTSIQLLFLADDIAELRGLVKLSGDRSTPLASSRLHFPGNSSSYALSNKDDCLQAVQVVLEGIDCLPAPTSLSDVLRLIHDPCIADFRHSILHWARRIGKDRTRAIEAMKRDVAKANRQIRRLGVYRDISRFLVYLAVPTSAIPYVGLPIAAIGAAVQIAHDVSRWRNRWLLIGRH